jgi:hypothetical protein
MSLLNEPLGSIRCSDMLEVAKQLMTSQETQFHGGS